MKKKLIVHFFRIFARTAEMLNTVFMSLFCAGLIGIIAAGTGNCIDYYVSPDGSDTANTGTIGSPFQTIAKARDVVRTVNSSMSGNINVYLRGGWYTLSSALSFTSSDSGRNGYNVIYQAYGSERPVISGGRQITGWTLHDSGKNIWKASASGLNTRQLYVNCVRAVRAHKGSGLPGASKTSSGYYTSDSSMQNWGNKTDIEFVFNGNQGGTGDGSSWHALWVEHRIGVAGISGNYITMKDPAWSNVTSNSPHPALSANIPTDIENAYELLDQQGEWYLNRSQGIVYYIPRSGENMSTAVVVAPVLETLVSGSSVNNVQFKGITFAHATWLRPSGNEGFLEHQANSLIGTWAYIPANVYFDYSQSLRFERCMFKHLGSIGLHLGSNCKNNVVTGCVFTDISGNNILLGNNTDPAGSSTRATGNQVTNCYVHDSCVEYHGGVGIVAAYTADTLISHNEIAYVPYSSISEGWGWGQDPSYYMQNNQITYNYGHDFCQVMSDGGGIYTLSDQPGTKINNNWFDNMPWTSNGGAIYPDEESKNIEIYNNVCSSIGHYWLHINSSQYLNIHDNYTTTSSEYLLAGGWPYTVNNTTIISGSLSNWPSAAQNIANNAGISSSYSDIKTMACACSGGSVTPTAPSITAHPANATVTVGQTATFSVSASGTSPLSYQWQKNQANISGATSASYTTPVTSLSDSGSKFRCVVSNSYGNATSNEATLAVSEPGDSIRIEAEDYNTGGEGVGYHDTTSANEGGAYRSDGVDIISLPPEGYIVGWTLAGEWLKYNVDVTKSGTYTLEVRVSAEDSYGKFHIEMDGTDVTGQFTMPASDGSLVWSTLSKTGISLTAGQHVMKVCLDTNGSGNLEVANLNYINLTYTGGGSDTTPPGAPGAVRDGSTAGVDISSTTSRTQLSANWTQAADVESGISGYNYAIGSSPGATNITNWTALGNVLTVTKTGLSLTIGTTYYFSVKAVNGAGLTGSAANSNGQVVLQAADTTAPGAPGTVRDGTGTTDINSTTSRTQLSANWTPSADSESGISGYNYAIGSSPGATNITNWTAIGNVLTATKTGLNLSVGTTYYFSVKATNGAGLTGSAANSNGQVVISTAVADTTAPSSPATVRDGPTAGTDAGFTYSTTTLSANWTAAADGESGIANYQYAIGTTAGATNITNWTSLGNVLTATKTGLSLSVGTTYYFSVKAVNGAGLAGAAANSNGQYVATVNTADTTPPSNISQVNDGNDAGVDAGVTYLTDELSANWSAAADAESGISRYLYAIGTSAGGTNVTNGWKDNGALTEATETGLTLAIGTTYYFSVKSENGVGLQSAPANSNGQFVLSQDTQGPLISNVSAQGITNAGATITWQTDEPATSRVEYGLSASYGSLTGEYLGMNTAHSVSISGLQPATQYHYRVISRDYAGNESASADYSFTTLSTLNTQLSSLAYPNPCDFSNGEVIKFKAGAGSETGEVRIFTMSGKLVRKLRGTGAVEWDGTNDAGEKVKRGIYIYTLTNGSGDKITCKLAVLK